MPTDAEFLEALRETRQNYILTLKNLSADQAAGTLKPTYNIDGQSVNWTRYQEILMKNIKDLTEQIAQADDPLYTEDTQAIVNPPYGARD